MMKTFGKTIWYFSWQGIAVMRAIGQRLPGFHFAASLFMRQEDESYKFAPNVWCSIWKDQEGAMTRVWSMSKLPNGKYSITYGPVNV